jgi:hypothetical protein
MSHQALSEQEQALLALFKNLTEYDKRFILGYMQLSSARNKPARPALRVINGGRERP